jgi:hypothetical protein
LERIKPFACRANQRRLLLSPVQPLLQKYFPSPPPQIKSISIPIPSLRGALAIVTNVGAGCDGRGSARAHTLIAGRISVSDSRGAQTNGAFADGEVVWS